MCCIKCVKTDSVFSDLTPTPETKTGKLKAMTETGLNDL